MDSPVSLPTGTVTFLFTDIEGSTRLWEQHPEAMPAALARHDALLIAGIQQHGGVVVKSRGEGDSLFAVFPRATDALAAACTLQQALLAEPWPLPSPLRVRMALHTGEAAQRDGDYYGPALNRCARLRAAAHGDQVLLSLATQELVRDALPAGVSLKDLGLCRLRDLQRPETVFQLLHPDLPDEFPALRSLDTLPHNLPQPLTSFIGREREIATVKQLLASTRLLTLTGSGGTGKSRLSLQVAADILEDYPDGVWLVELASLADPTLIPQAVATVLGVREQPGQPLIPTLTVALKPKRLLLVLDNCEHLLTACAQLADHLLRGSPHLRILASSREGLGISGEQTYRVPSLSLPDPKQLPPLQRLHEFEGVHLFTDRAVLSQSTFIVTDQNASAVVQVCQRLDGIPLAIELAAARVRVLSVEQIADRLDDRFRLLTGGSRTALPRQQTLRALIDWSYDLLSEPERALLRHLSVFAGGWTLEAAEAVGEGDSVAAGEVLDRLTSLVDKSLVVYDEHAGAGRYRLLETVRQYARDRLMEAGNGAAVRGRHRDFFLALAEAAAPELCGADQLRWLDRLDGEHDNLRLALSWCQARPGHSELELRLGGALFLFWRMRGHCTEGLAWLEAALARAPAHGPPSRARARALMGAGHLGFYQHEDFAAVAARLAESAALWREIGDQRELAYTLAYLGGSAEYSARIPILEEGVALAREVGDGWVLATALWQLAMNVRRFLGDQDRAEALARESAARFREAGDRWGVAGPLGLLGWIAEARGDSRTAIAMHEAALALQREVGDPWRIGLHLCQLARYALAGGNVERAECLSQEGLAFHRRAGDRLVIIESLLDLAKIAGRQRETEKEWALLEEAEALGRELGYKGQMSNIFMSQGDLLLDGGDYSAGRSRYEEGLALRRQTEDPNSIACALVEVGHAAWLQGEAGVTQSHAVEALRLFQALGNEEGLLAALESLAVAALAQGPGGGGPRSGGAGPRGAAGGERSARLLGAVSVLREALGLPGASWWRRPRERIGEAARAVSLHQGFAAAWAAGRALSLDQAVEYALEGETLPNPSH